MKIKVKQYCSFLTRAILCVVAFSPLYAQSQSSDNVHFRSVDCDKGQSIQFAVDQVGNDGIIEVSGTCTEIVVVNYDRVIIGGVGDATVIGTPNSFGTFKIHGRRVAIQDFILQGEIGVLIEQGGSALVRNNIIEDVTNTGITIKQSSFGDIRGNEITGNGNFSGIFLTSNSSAEIYNNTVTSSDGGGIGIDGVSSAVVGNNTLSSNNNGIQVFENSYMFLPSGQANIITDNNGRGVVCDFSSVIRVDQEQIFERNVFGEVFLGTCDVRNFVGVPFP